MNKLKEAEFKILPFVVDEVLAVLCGVFVGLESCWLVKCVDMKEFEDAGDNDGDGVGSASGISTVKEKPNCFSKKTLLGNFITMI